MSKTELDCSEEEFHEFIHGDTPHIEDLKEGEIILIPYKVVRYIIQNKVTLVEAYCWYYGKDVKMVLDPLGLTLEKLYDRDDVDPLNFENVAKSIDSSLTMEHLFQ